ncbi:ABC transporter substrate-binding protein [Actinopolymorpha pittospori]|uniref:Alpha-glucoside transport system substrate-binding protein n=1 Tax=Actinopolymorpha pittospori TaxID=648752 RepID=A0A927N8J7_9ACTN|nr:ABC transporter substrate-binding protein [Actinopolymorpha pittospori]MBE1610932.1 alpha-glucoside transport system substrate-binding protein [Actinopolymorpha pittospori]
MGSSAAETGTTPMPALRRRALLRAAALAPLAPVVAGCGIFGRPPVRVAVSWSGGELAAFRKVLAGLGALRGFEPMAYDVQPVPFGDDISTALAARGAGRLDVVMLPVLGELRRYRDILAPAPIAPWPKDSKTYTSLWHDLLFEPAPGARSEAGPRVPYGVPFKLSNKSCVWYSRDLFEKHSLRPPDTWDDWLALNRTLVKRRITPLALGAADGWALTDFFENVLLGTSPDTYDWLTTEADRQPLWSGETVRTALRRLAQLWGARDVLAGGVKGSLVRQFPDAVLEVFRYRRAAMAVAPDFAEPYARRFHHADGARREHDIATFPFPTIAERRPAPLVAGGDVAVLTSPSREDAKDLVRRLAHPLAPLPWIESPGGFLAANRETPVRSYTKQAEALASPMMPSPSTFRFDLSDQLGAVGGRDGMWRALRNFLVDIGGSAESAGSVESAADRFVAHMIAIEERESEAGDDRGGTDAG